LDRKKARFPVNPHSLKTIEDLKPSPDNPRTIDDHARKGLRYSLDEFGNISGITWNKRSGHLVAGHQRIAILSEQGAKLVGDETGPYIETIGGERFPIRVVDWGEDKEIEAKLAANNQEIAGRWTPDVGDMVRKIRERNKASFEGLRLREVLRNAPKPPPVIREDETPEPPANPVTKLGDVWELGRHRVVCGDARSQNNRENADCVFTDPPYGISYQSRVDERRRKNWGAIAGDDLRGDRLIEFLRECIPEAKHRYICCPWETYVEFVAALGRPRSVCVWDKGWIGLGSGYRRQFELVLFYGTIHRRDLADVWTMCRDSGYQHPTQKPVALAAKAIADCGAMSVFDPFLGSGTALIAAEQLDRMCYGIEIEPKYVDVAIERWENLTGEKAKRVTNA
jgi:hypothetical protein